MERLTATFDIALPGRLLITRPIMQELQFETHIDDYDVEIILPPAEDLSHGQNDLGQSWQIFRVLVSVNRSESNEPPLLVHLPSGGRDITNRRLYFEMRRETYVKIAVESVNRLLHFFKYRLAHGYLRDITSSDIPSPTWIDETGRTFEDGIVSLTAEFSMNFLSGQTDVEAFTASGEGDLQEALAIPIELQLHEEILADARAALFQRHVRRAVLEAAISCEVALKQTLTAKDPTRNYEEKNSRTASSYGCKRTGTKLQGR